MRHEHLPALNRYTSQNQYAALQEIDKTGSLVSLITQGRMGTTIGALIRSAWMDSEVIKNEEGVTSERWFVTDAGKHAMQLYEIKLEQDRKKAEAEEEVRRVREQWREQQVTIEKETLKLMDQYFKHLLEVHVKLKEEWKHITTVAAKGNIDQRKWQNMEAIARERNGLRRSSYAKRDQDPDW